MLQCETTRPTTWDQRAVPSVHDTEYDVRVKSTYAEMMTRGFAVARMNGATRDARQRETAITSKTIANTTLDFEMGRSVFTAVTATGT